jgi:hypothetical protein
VHLFRSKRRIYPAKPLRAAADSKARIGNLDLDAPDSPLSSAWIHHLNITANREIQQWILGRIMETINPAKIF